MMIVTPAAAFKRLTLLASCWLVGLVVTGCTPATDSLKPVQVDKLTQVFLVRHAEKASDDRDPELNEQGKLRAQSLARLLADKGVDYLWSSDYRRTKQTLGPFADQSGLTIAIYDARDSQELVSTIFATGIGKTHVIAGHSNTVPELVDIIEAWPDRVASADARPHLGHSEYNRLYVITWAEGRKPVVEATRFDP